MALSCNIINAYANNYHEEYSDFNNESISVLAFDDLNTIPIPPIGVNDSLERVSADTVNRDTTVIDSLKDIVKNPKKAESAFKSKVTYHGDDSIMIDNRNNKAYMLSLIHI